MNRISIFALAALVFSVALSGCVSTKKYDAMRAQAMRAERQVDTANAAIKDLQADKDRLQGTLDKLSADRANLRKTLDSLAAASERLRGANDDLNKTSARQAADAAAQAAALLAQLEANQRELDARMARMRELEAALQARDAALESIKNKVSDALLGFTGKGLTITRRDGKVYVSMEDKLLFKSGSYEVDPNGARAVRDLASVLADNPDIEVTVEGHTDNVPYRANGQLRDNLDLSVKRATTVTRLLLENRGIAPARITSAGRGEWLPVNPANTPEARASNRRTEIILSPKLDELLKITQ
jgi:chemotaxis protein MotB